MKNQQTSCNQVLQRPRHTSFAVFSRNVWTYVSGEPPVSSSFLSCGCLVHHCSCHRRRRCPSAHHLQPAGWLAVASLPVTSLSLPCWHACAQSRAIIDKLKETGDACIATPDGVCSSSDTKFNYTMRVTGEPGAFCCWWQERRAVGGWGWEAPTQHVIWQVEGAARRLPGHASPPRTLPPPPPAAQRSSALPGGSRGRQASPRGSSPWRSRA